MSHDQLVAEVVADLLDLDADELTGDTPLTDIDGWDSLNALRVLVYLERQLGTSLDYESYAAAVTVADLMAVVARTAEASGAGVPAAGRAHGEQP